MLDKSDRLTYVASGCIKTGTEELPVRLKTIWQGLCEIIDTYQPQQVAVEKVFVNVNPQSTLLLGQARGVAICAAVAQELAVFEYTALQVKQTVVGENIPRVVDMEVFEREAERKVDAGNARRRQMLGHELALRKDGVVLG